MNPTELFAIAKKGELLPTFEISLVKQDPDGYTALHLAAGEGDLQAVVNLLEWGVAASLETENGGLPVVCALNMGHIEVAKVLLDAGGLVDPLLDQNILDLPAMHDDTQAIELLVDAGAKVNGSSGFRPPLVWAVQENCVEACKLLLDMGASTTFTEPQINPDGSTTDDHSAIEMASGESRPEILKLLLARTSFQDDDAKNALNRALDLAIAYSYEEIVSILEAHL